MRTNLRWARSLLIVLAVAFVGLPAAPAVADEDACTHRGFVQLGGFAPGMNGLPPYFYYVEEGAGTSFRIEASDPCVGHPYTMSVDYDTPPGSPNAATPGSDYVRASGTATFNVSGDSEHYSEARTIPFSTTEDASVEPAAEEVDVTLSNATNAFIQAPNPAPLFIVDDDGSSRVRFVTSSATEVEAARTLRIPVLLAGSSSTAPVSFTVSPSSPSDLEPSSGSVSWASGGRLGTVNLTMKNDSLCESTETFTISLSGVGTEAPSTFTLTITDNDSSCGTTHTLTVSKNGTGSGTVTSSPAGINCGPDCTEAYAQGTSVTLTASPAAGSTFGGWSGACTGGSATCTVSMTQARNVTATFNQTTPTTHTLTVTKSGTGSGTVTSNPAGINCGTDCTQDYEQGTSVTLTANPAAGSTFAGWSGACTGASATCTVTMSADRNVTAVFNQQTAGQRTLTVTKAGTGSGTVTSSPSGISCGTDCTQQYNDGTSVTLTASPAAGSTFGGWSGGGCTGTQPTCTVSMTQDRTVTATFTSQTTEQFTLTVIPGGNAAQFGTVTSSPAGISCGEDCTQAYDEGTTVTLTASPSSLFVGWAGECAAVSGNTCTVQMTADRSVNAIFEDTQAPRAWFHHPKHGERYRQGSFGSDTIHVFATDNAGKAAVERTVLAIRKKLTNGDCRWWKRGAWRSGECGAPKLFELTTRYPDGAKWLYIYDAYPSLRPSVGTRIANYTVYTRSTDAVGNTSGFVTGDSRNTFEVTRR